MIVSKGCQRCGGDLAQEHDRYGSYVACIQCSAEDKELTRLVSGPPSRLQGSIRREDAEVVRDHEYSETRVLELTASRR